ncbi:MAG: D-alanine--D-alanine ligase A [Clostridia bacterium]|nr:MAG: D-alanine--D-alanine ligase A [Clostridia bacterium]
MNTSPKTTVGILFGGQSGEHDVSLMSVQSVLGAIDYDRYDVIPIGIDKTGRWLFDNPLKRLLNNERASDNAPRWPTSERLAGIDILFPVLHGPYGEDGILQGFFELVDIPYVGNGVLASSTAMDKALSKRIFQARGFPITPWETVRRTQLEAAPNHVLARLEAALDYPMFTKPANLGSSVGICKVTNKKELLAGLREAAHYDIMIVVEQAVPHVREIEVSVMGNDHPQASLPGEIIPGNDFYDYEAKYFSQTSQTLVPAPLQGLLSKEAQNMAIRAFQAIHGSGLARVDFLLDDAANKLYLNEINTMPGFTTISMFPKLWQASGIPYPELIHQLIQLGFEHYQQKHTLQTSIFPQGIQS